MHECHDWLILMPAPRQTLSPLSAGGPLSQLIQAGMRAEPRQKRHGHEALSAGWTLAASASDKATSVPQPGRGKQGQHVLPPHAPTGHPAHDNT